MYVHLLDDPIKFCCSRIGSVFFSKFQSISSLTIDNILTVAISSRRSDVASSLHATERRQTEIHKI